MAVESVGWLAFRQVALKAEKRADLWAVLMVASMAEESVGNLALSLDALKAVMMAGYSVEMRVELWVELMAVTTAC